MTFVIRCHLKFKRVIRPKHGKRERGRQKDIEREREKARKRDMV